MLSTLLLYFFYIIVEIKTSGGKWYFGKLITNFSNCGGKSCDLIGYYFVLYIFISFLLLLMSVTRSS